MKKIRIGTRGSRLALIQARMAQAAIETAFPQAETELVILHTRGDKILDKPLAQIGDKGLFVSEFEQAILKGEIDMAVHSAKDLPMRLAEGLTIGAVLPRADVRDVLVILKNGSCPRDRARAGETAHAMEDPAAGTAHEMEDPAAGKTAAPDFILGTGSRRRCVQAERIWENIVCRPIRGNVETRLHKLEDGKYDGLLLAKAGLDRLGIDESSHPQFSFYPLEPDRFWPAACQGIVALEVREDSFAAEMLRGLTDAETELAFRVERRVLTLLQADCSEPAAAWCRRRENGLALDVLYGSGWAAGFCHTLSGGSRDGDAADHRDSVLGKEQMDGELLRAALRMAENTVKALKGRRE